MNTRTWLQLCHFSAAHGIQEAWHSTNRPQFISNSSDKNEHKLMTMFPNFACSIIVQGHEVMEGLHGPFVVRDLPDTAAFVHTFILPGKYSILGERENIFFLILYMNVDTAFLIDNQIRNKLNQILKQWSKSFLDDQQLNEKEMIQLQKTLDRFFQLEIKSKLMDLNIDKLKTTLKNSIISLTKQANRLPKDICITLWSKNQVARQYNVLVFQALQEEILKNVMSTNTLSNEQSSKPSPAAWLTHDEMHSLLRINHLNILAVEELSSVYLLPSQSYIFLITPEVNIPSFLKDVGKNIDWEDVIRVFFLVLEDSRKKITTMKRFCHVLEQYHPNIKKATTINVSWIKKNQLITLFHVFNDLIVESILYHVSRP